jgi:hypothetical protein
MFSDNQTIILPLLQNPIVGLLASNLAKAHREIDSVSEIYPALGKITLLWRLASASIPVCYRIFFHIFV